VPPPKSAAVGVTLTSSSLGANTTIVAGSMLSATRGFALAAGPSTPVGFVVETGDAGRRWIVRGIVPFSMSRAEGFIPKIDFLTPSLGYVESDLTNATYVTRDGGRSWQQLEEQRSSAFVSNGYPPPVPSFVVTGGRVFRSGEACSGFSKCRPILAEFSLGATRATRVLLPPAMPLQYADPMFVLSPSPGTLVLVEGPGLNGAALYVSHDAGMTWSRSGFPCGADMPVSSVVRVQSGSWLLSCFRGEGMTQGRLEMWRSANEGSSWSEVAAGNEGAGLHTFGNLPDAAALLGSSNDGRVQWGLLGWAPGGLMMSADGGATWSVLHQNTGDSWESLAAAGSHGVVVFTPGASLWSTNGTRFVARRLPATR
jgi:photosystem II stability/assembly factor-like uncharacterized protein